MSAGRRGRRPLRGAAQVCPVGRRIDCPFGYHRSLRVQFTSAGRRGRRPLRGTAQGSPCRATDRSSLRVSSIPTGAVRIGGPSGTPAPTSFSYCLLPVPDCLQTLSTVNSPCPSPDKQGLSLHLSTFHFQLSTFNCHLSTTRCPLRFPDKQGLSLRSFLPPAPNSSLLAPNSSFNPDP